MSKKCTTLTKSTFKEILEIIIKFPIKYNVEHIHLQERIALKVSL